MDGFSNNHRILCFPENIKRDEYTGVLIPLIHADNCLISFHKRNISIRNIRMSSPQFHDILNKIKTLDPRGNGTGSDYISHVSADTALNQPNLTIDDIMNQDIQNIIIQQNNMYIIGTITSITLIILGIYLTKQ